MADSVHSDRNLMLRLRVTEGGSGVPGARLTVRFARSDAAPLYARVVTDPGGDAEMRVEMDESSLPNSSVLVQANYLGRIATRKFQLRKATSSAQSMPPNSELQCSSVNILVAKKQSITGPKADNCKHSYKPVVIGSKPNKK